MLWIDVTPPDMCRPLFCKHAGVYQREAVGERIICIVRAAVLYAQGPEHDGGVRVVSQHQVCNRPDPAQHAICVSATHRFAVRISAALRIQQRAGFL